jgi:hypothetical protein
VGAASGLCRCALQAIRKLFAQLKAAKVAAVERTLPAVVQVRLEPHAQTVDEDLDEGARVGAVGCGIWFCLAVVPGIWFCLVAAVRLQRLLTEAQAASPIRHAQLGQLTLFDIGHLTPCLAANKRMERTQQGPKAVSAPECASLR